MADVWITDALAVADTAIEAVDAALREARGLKALTRVDDPAPYVDHIHDAVRTLTCARAELQRTRSALAYAQRYPG